MRFLGLAALLLTVLRFPAATAVLAQSTGTIVGTVTRSDDGTPLASVTVGVRGPGTTAVTNTQGRYQIDRVPAGTYILVFRWLGYKPAEVAVTVTAGSSVTANATLEPHPIALSDLVVTTASKAPERVTQAPAAISVIDARTLQSTSITGQAPLALAAVPGVDLAQNGVNDFNVNTRGFNSSLNRRVLVLIDGRDVATGFLGNQEWNALPIPTEDIAAMELVRGPGSALYGANAYAGVLNIKTPTAREVVGTKVSIGGGQLSTAKADIRHAGLFYDGRFGYRVNVGYYRSDTWSRSRTAIDGYALSREYAPATDSLLFRGICSSCIRRELRPLNGQTADPVTGALTGERDPVKSTYGSARLDYYSSSGDVATGEFGMAVAENETAVTGIGRVQITKSIRPYARFNYAAKSFDIMGYWNGRNTKEPQYSLASGAGLKERSDVFHLEAQQKNTFAGDRGRFVLGASLRKNSVNTQRTLINRLDDDRSDNYYALFSQLEYKLSDVTKLVLAGRYDLGGLIDGQFSPKAALVYTPSDRHSFRFTFNKAFQTPNYSEFFLNAAAGAPVNFTALEAGIRASALGPALVGVPEGQLFDNSAAVPIRARGNSKLLVEKNTGLEIGYRSDLTDKLFVSLDAYVNVLKDFVTDLLPGANSSFAPWTAPSAVPAAFRGALATAVRNILLSRSATATAGRGLTRQEDGKTAIVVSYANAGKATQHGFELAAGIQLADEFRADANLTVFRFTIKEQLAGDQLLPNTPSAKGNVVLTYAGRQGLDLGLNFRMVKGYDWAAGVFAGWIEPQSLVDLNAGYAVNNNLRVYLTANNVFNQQRYSLFGGSVNGRRMLGGLTTRF